MSLLTFPVHGENILKDVHIIYYATTQPSVSIQQSTNRCTHNILYHNHTTTLGTLYIKTCSNKSINVYYKYTKAPTSKRIASQGVASINK